MPTVDGFGWTVPPARTDWPRCECWSCELEQSDPLEGLGHLMEYVRPIRMTMHNVAVTVKVYDALAMEGAREPEATLRSVL